MTTKTKELEEKFNKAFPPIRQADPSETKPQRFNKADFLKAAKELQRVVKNNDKLQPPKP